MNSKGNNTTSSHTTSSNIPSSHNNNETSFNINYLIRNVQSNQLSKIKQNSIHTKNLNSCVYYENINNTGKNILLIGEHHLEDVDVSPIIHFFNSLIENKDNQCLDIFIEDSRSHIPLKNSQKYIFGNYDYVIASTISEIREFIWNYKDDTRSLRKHYIDYRITFGYGFLNCVFYMITQDVIDESSIFSNNIEKYNILLFLLNLKNEDGYEQGERLVFQKLKDSNNLNFKKMKQQEKIEIKEFCKFITDNNINTLDQFYNKINEINEDIRKPLLNRFYINKSYDDKINKQINNIDTEYFTKEKLLEYYKNVNFEFNVTLFDIIAITRMFRKFDISKNRLPPCNNETKSLKNIVLYGGQAHTDQIQTFIEKVILNDGGNYKKIDTYFIPIRFNYFNFFPNYSNDLVLIDKNKEFILACEINDIVKFEELLNNYDIDVNVGDNVNNSTSLMIACKNGHTDITRLLLKRNDIKVNVRNNEGNTALMFACEYRYRDIIEILLTKNDINVNEKNNEGNTVLMIACLYRYTEIVKLLLERDDIQIEINEKNNEGDTVLMIACYLHYYEIVKLLLERDDINVNEKNKEGNTALMIACEYRYTDIVKLLLERDDINVNEKNKEGNTALMIACEREYRDIIELLLERDDINVNEKNGKDGWTVLMIACQNRYTDIVQLLLARDDINVNEKNNEGNTALLIACLRGYMVTVQLLLARDDIDINEKNNEGKTVLMIACENKKFAIFELLLARNDIDINVRNNEGKTITKYIQKITDQKIKTDFSSRLLINKKKRNNNQNIKK